MESLFPLPEIPYRDALADEIPRSAEAVAALARSAGWSVRVTYARGTRPGRVPRVVDSVAVRCGHPDGRRTAAIWIDGKFDVALQGRPTLRSLTYQKLRAELKGEA